MAFLSIFLSIPPLHSQVIPPKGGEKIKWTPRTSPNVTGPFDVAIIIVEFQETELDTDIYTFKKTLDNVRGMSQEEYFKVYTNDTTWPVFTIYPDEKKESIYKAPHIMGYYCRYDYWSNPVGYGNEEEGNKRVAKLKEDALKAAKSKSKNMKYRTLSYNFITTRIKDTNRLPDIRKFYSAGHRKYLEGEEFDEQRAKRAERKSRSKKTDDTPSEGDSDFNPWEFYWPSVNWGEPLWPHSGVQMFNASSSTMAHELGHTLGAPDLYRVGKFNDGIGGDASLFPYGPTASAFSRFYHHGYIKEANHPLINQSGTYTLHPRHIAPSGDQKVGYVIPSSHPHYFYQVEYIYNEKKALQTAVIGVEGDVPPDKDSRNNRPEDASPIEGMLISVLNLGVTSYLGSPDLQYIYRPNDPYFRGEGDKAACLFGEKYGRTEFGIKTEPSSRLPNLLDGGITISNIKENKGTLTFDLEIYKVPLSSSDYKRSLLPQVKLHEITEILPTSFLAECNIKFRGEPLKSVLGFCWGKRSKPTIQNEYAARIHNDLYKARAINLDPDSTYYVRAFVASELGIRYSDEEMIVKTPTLKDAPSDITPLLLDKFSHNWEIYSKVSKIEGYSNYRGYSPTAVLGKLLAYYAPPKFGNTEHSAPSPIATIGKKIKESKSKKSEPIDFDRLNWNPNGGQPKWRHGETLALFFTASDLSDTFHMHEGDFGDIHKDFMRNMSRALKPKTKPEVRTVTQDNMAESLELIKQELIHSRPVLIVLAPSHPEKTNPPQWALIDGIKGGNLLHVDFPHGTKTHKEKEAYLSMEDIMVSNYTLKIIAPLAF